MHVSMTAGAAEPAPWHCLSSLNWSKIKQNIRRGAIIAIVERLQVTKQPCIPRQSGLAYLIMRADSHGGICHRLFLDLTPLGAMQNKETLVLLDRMRSSGLKLHARRLGV